MPVELKNVTYGYSKKRPVIKDVSLAVNEGERVAMIGPSGCGKSTTAQIMAGNLRPDAGQVLLDGAPLPKKGYCPVQLIHQHPETAVDPRWKLGQTLTEAWNPDRELLDALGIEPAWLSRYPTELSGGEMQRFCIARALAPQTRFIIADEISAMLDVVTQAQVWELLLQAVEKRRLGLLVITHSPALAERICSRTVDFTRINHMGAAE